MTRSKCISKRSVRSNSLMQSRRKRSPREWQRVTRKLKSSSSTPTWDSLYPSQRNTWTVVFHFWTSFRKVTSVLSRQLISSITQRDSSSPHMQHGGSVRLSPELSQIRQERSESLFTWLRPLTSLQEFSASSFRTSAESLRQKSLLKLWAWK